jgi:hypothetical protein
MICNLKKNISKAGSAGFEVIAWLTAKPIEEPIQWSDF